MLRNETIHGLKKLLSHAIGTRWSPWKLAPVMQVSPYFLSAGLAVVITLIREPRRFNIVQVFVDPTNDSLELLNDALISSVRFENNSNEIRVLIMVRASMYSW